VHRAAKRSQDALDDEYTNVHGYSFNNVITELKDGLYSCTQNKLLYLRNGAI